MIAAIYLGRWKIEVEYRGLKQTTDKGTLRCRNSARVYAELDWSIRAMAFAELVALREQLRKAEEIPTEPAYDPKDRSLANTIRALRRCMRNLNHDVDPCRALLSQLAEALVQKYENQTDKRARYRPPNPDKKPLGDPNVMKRSPKAREKLAQLAERIAAQKCFTALPSGASTSALPVSRG